MVPAGSGSGDSAAGAGESGACGLRRGSGWRADSLGRLVIGSIWPRLSRAIAPKKPTWPRQADDTWRGISLVARCHWRLEATGVGSIRGPALRGRETSLVWNARLEPRHRQVTGLFSGFFFCAATTAVSGGLTQRKSAVLPPAERDWDAQAKELLYLQIDWSLPFFSAG